MLLFTIFRSKEVQLRGMILETLRAIRLTKTTCLFNAAIAKKATNKQKRARVAQ